MNNFNLKDALEILERTPAVLISLLSGLSDRWIYNNEGGESWNPYDIAGHMIHGEKRIGFRELKQSWNTERINHLNPSIDLHSSKIRKGKH